jgi:hypothetical protein
VEFVPRFAWTTQSEPIKLKNALKMGEQYLDLFAQLAGYGVFDGLGDLSCDIASTPSAIKPIVSAHVGGKPTLMGYP